MRLRRLLVGIGAVLALGLALGATSASAFQHIKVREVYAGGASAGSYVELQMYEVGQNLVNGKKLAVYKANGEVDHTYLLPGNVGYGQSQRTILVAGPGYAGPASDFTDPLLSLSPAAGAVCWLAGEPRDCVSWGGFTGNSKLPNPGAGNPVSPAGVSAGKALRRSIAPGCAQELEEGDDTDDSASDFSEQTPDPRANPAPIEEDGCGPNIQRAQIEMFGAAVNLGIQVLGTPVHCPGPGVKDSLRNPPLAQFLPSVRRRGRRAALRVRRINARDGYAAGLAISTGNQPLRGIHRRGPPRPRRRGTSTSPTSTPGVGVSGAGIRPKRNSGANSRSTPAHPASPAGVRSRLTRKEPSSPPPTIRRREKKATGSLRYSSDGTRLLAIDTGKYQPTNQCFIALDSHDNLYVNAFDEVWKYTKASNYTQATPFIKTPHVTIGGFMTIDKSDDHLFMISPDGQQVREYNSSGELLMEFGKTYGVHNNAFDSIAVNEGTNQVYVHDNFDRFDNRVRLFAPPAAVPVSTTDRPKNVTTSSATLFGHIDMHGGEEVIDCFFEYGTDGFGSFFEGQVPCDPTGPPGEPIDEDVDVSGQLRD